MSWQIFLIIAVFGDSLGRIALRFLMQDDKSDPISYAIVSQTLTGVVIGVIVLFYGFRIPKIEPILFNLLLLPILWGVANILIFKSLKYTEASLFTIFFSTRTIWAVIGAILFLHESFSFAQVLGTILIIFAVFLVSGNKGKIKIQKGELLALLSAIFVGIAIVNDSTILKTFDALSYTPISFIAPGLFILLTNPKSGYDLPKLFKKDILRKIILMGFFYGGASIAYFYAYQIGRNAGQIASIFQISSILSVILAIIILKERSNLFIKLLAGVLSLFGVLLVK